jgi:enterochelin esterase-like enzyme
VIPPAGIDVHHGDWTGVWERYLVRDVVPWADAHLPTIAARSGRVLAGLSAGGYGAVSIGLRHPELFSTLESWSGYFHPLRSGALVHAGVAQLHAHDPTLLARREAPLLRRLGTRFFVSSGTTHDRVTAEATRTFSTELRTLRLPHRLWLGAGGHDGRLWRAQLPAALSYSLLPGRLD